ncbi:hypothetical protein BDR03DRAFT_988226, partial [Suillus americanus]
SDVSDVEDPKSIAKALSTEIPTFISGSKAKNLKPLGRPTPVWANDVVSDLEESSDDSSASALKPNTSTLVNASTSLSSIDDASSRATSRAPSTVEKAKFEPDMSDIEFKSDVSSVIDNIGMSTHHSGSPSATKLVLTKDGKDEACNQVAAYLCLQPNGTASASTLLVNHRYHYFMKFDDDDVPKPVQNKPHLGDLMIHLMKCRYFNESKSVGVMFAKKFSDIAKNKAKRPEPTIPMVALTATSVYAALFWKANGSLNKFNFTENQFSEVYFFHAKFLKDLNAKSPEKFHKLIVALFKHLDTMQSLSKEVDSSLQESEFKPWIVDWTKWEIPGGWPVEKVVPDVPSKIDEQPEDWLKGAPEWFLEAEEVLKTDERLRACGHSVCECEREKRPSES